MTSKHLEWRLPRILDNDDLDRLKRFFDEVKMLARDDWVSMMLESALREAGEKNAVRCLEWLAQNIGEGAWDKFNQTALMRAIWAGQFDAFKALLPHANMQHRNKEGHTALMSACRANKCEHVEAIIPYASVDAEGRGQKTAMMMATENGCDALWAILPHANRSLRDCEGYNALMHAIRNENKEALAILLERSTSNEVFSRSRHKMAISAFELAQQVQSRGGLKAADMIREEFARREAAEIENVVRQVSAKVVRADVPRAPRSREPKRI